MHFLVGVVLDELEQDEALSLALAEEELGRFGYDYDDPDDAYSEEDCGCVGSVATALSWLEAERRVGRTRNEMQDEVNTWQETRKASGEPTSWEERRTFSEFVMAPLLQEFKLCYSEHPLRDKPSPTCGNGYSEENVSDMLAEHGGNVEVAKLAYSDCCFGTGTVYSRGNPNGRWDWYELGGRWDGVVSDTLVRLVPYPCPLCKGTGRREDADTFDADWNTRTHGCNGCLGTRYQDAPVFLEDDVLARNSVQLKNLDPSVLSDCIVDGMWTEVENTEWLEQLKIDRPEAWLIGFDCHS